MWAASYCTLFRGIDAKRAASWASLFYVGITIGRFFCGFITMKLNDQKMIRLGQAVIAVGTILMLLPLGDSLLFIGLILIGLGCAPIYPSIIHETPANFGADLSQGIIGIQMAFCLRRNLPDAAGFRCSRPAYFLRTVSGIPDGHFDSDGCNGRADAPRNGGKEKFL